LNNSLTAILKDKAGNIWMASDYGKFVGDTLGGAWCYNPLGTRNTGLYQYDGKTLINFSE
jgi:hypothetical protein